jgi:hypothetical protein
MRRRVLEVWLGSALALPGFLLSREVDDRTLAGEIQAYLEERAASDQFSGAVAVLSNYDPPAAGSVAEKIQSLLLREQA